MSATAFVMPNDLSDLCRVCLQLPEESQYLDLTTIYDEDDNLTYGECFTICTQIDLSAGEGVPHHLCKSCGLELQMSYDFHKKIEESKKVIEQCQKQIEEQKRNSNREESQGLHSNASGERREVVQLLNEKYVISDDEEDAEELAGSSQEIQVVNIMQSEFDTPAQEVDETDDMDIINKICNIEDNTPQEILPDNDRDTTMEHMDAHDVADEAEEMDDYQNLETLEDEGKKRTKVKTNLKIKTETANEDQQTMLQEEIFKVPTETYSLKNELNKEIKTEISMENNDNQDPLRGEHYIISHVEEDNTTAEVIKIENETFSEYIVASPATIIPEVVDPPLATQQQLYGRSQPIGSPFVCEFCGHIMPTKNALYKHRLRKHNVKGFSGQDKPFNCHLCSKEFVTMSSLRLHINMSHLKKGFECEHCGYNLPTMNAVYQHRLRKHRDPKKQKKLLRYKCTQCSELFETAEGLSLHKTKKHAKKRTAATETNECFECEYCGYKLPTKNAFYQHRLRKHKRHKRILKIPCAEYTVTTHCLPMKVYKLESAGIPGVAACKQWG
ncbi:zinc finger protein weckle-like isoform X2 [Lucilia sericata]|uniref:zinc finger protein weckle-like isoform X2 n=1 Tax=Lucilia sericata TaxID=13632 RepID=UPI0018A80700|nr:zinc finger protein weckle-like isoform X2 [Lucilia sericata]